MSFNSSSSTHRARLLAAIALALLLACGLTSPAVAAKGDARVSGSDAILVSATVKAYAELEAETRPPALLITADDVARGFVEIDEAISTTVRTNSRDGYTLRLDWIGELFDGGRLLGDNVDTKLTAAGGKLDRATSGYTVDSTTLGLRIDLRATTEPGLYAWPVKATVSPR